MSPSNAKAWAITAAIHGTVIAIRCICITIIQINTGIVIRGLRIVIIGRWIVIVVGGNFPWIYIRGCAISSGLDLTFAAVISTSSARLSSGFVGGTTWVMSVSIVGVATMWCSIWTVAGATWCGWIGHFSIIVIGGEHPTVVFCLFPCGCQSITIWGEKGSISDMKNPGGLWQSLFLFLKYLGTITIYTIIRGGL